MVDLLTAIVARYNAAAGDTLRAATPGGLHPRPAPQNTAFDHLTWELVSSPTDFTMSTDFDMPTVRFGIWTDKPSPATIMSTSKLLIALYLDVKLVVSGYNTIRADLTDQREVPVDGLEEGRGYIVDFQYMIGK